MFAQVSTYLLYASVYAQSEFIRQPLLWQIKIHPTPCQNSTTLQFKSQTDKNLIRRLLLYESLFS